MPSFTTHVGLVVEWKAGPVHLVTITGERIKVLYEGDNMGEAKAVYDEVVAHYGEREKVKADPAAEGKVEFKPRRQRGAPSR
jgi:hypothetical protein